MAKTMQAKDIAGVRYEVTPLGAKTGRQVIFRLGIAIADLTKVDSGDIDWLCDTMAASTKVGIVDTAGNGKVTMMPLATVFDDHFMGDYVPMFEWLAFAVEVNFASFLGGVKDLLPTLKGLSSSTSPKAATGSSGASSSTNG